MKYRSVIRGCVSVAFLLLFFPLLVAGQERAALEAERKRILSGIRQLNTKLQQTRADKRELLETHALMVVQLESRQQLLDNLSQELYLADSLLAVVEDEICVVDMEISGLDAAYGALARNAFRLRLNKDLHAFVLSAVSINDLLRRIHYIRRYEQYRKKQARSMLEKQEVLSGLIQSRQKQREEKAVFLETIRDQKVLMEEELAKQNLLVVQIQKNEKDLLKAIDKEEESRKKLDGLIAGVISRSSAVTAAAPKAAAASGNTAFARSRGKLSWPVSEGFVLRKFGKQKHPTLRRVQVVNNGVDIESTGGRSVVGIFAGEVVGVQFVPGYDNTVIIRHDNFYTVYSNLSEVLVERGAKLGAGAKLGSLSAQKPVLHFEIWQDKTRLDPLLWLSPETKKQF